MQHLFSDTVGESNFEFRYEETQAQEHTDTDFKKNWFIFFLSGFSNTLQILANVTRAINPLGKI
jgi:hypothetical protein